ncbi:uncharacterized protein VP01_2582g2 [Puccinia sorghi]|uniref:Uncharacterized protein n=1 Tax=Puccinia sorghi TaxID=27349 RepID=A0A0L6V6M9_9BASI|nr:uncharacterized protein VP01_2582g2 [Puccinia sorghi]
MACEKCDTENSMMQFYAMQLRDAHKTIDNLRDEVTRLRTSNQSKVNSMQEKVTELKIQNQALKNKLEILQMRLEMSSACMTFPSQTLPIGPAEWFHPSNGF